MPIKYDKKGKYTVATTHNLFTGEIIYVIRDIKTQIEKKISLTELSELLFKEEENEKTNKG